MPVAQSAAGGVNLGADFGADPALDTIHPGDRIVLSWDESAPLLLGEPEPATTGPATATGH